MTSRGTGLFRSGFRIAILLAFVPSCASNAAAPKPKAAAPTAPPTWPSLSWAERHEVMTFTVLPNMGQAWQEFTRSDAPTLTCRTCHGANAEDVKYRMPNPELRPLDANRLPSKTSRDPNEARWATFMFDEVVPRMTHLIDAAPYDSKTRKGFGCFACHTVLVAQ